MASGDIAASTPTECLTPAAVETALDALNLAATTDSVHIIPIPGRDIGWYVFKTERTA